MAIKLSFSATLLIFLILLKSGNAGLLEECIQHVSPFDFLHQQNRTLHISRPVEIAAKKGRLNLNSPLQKPADKIEYWLTRIGKLHLNARSNKERIKIIRDYYLDRYTTKKSDVPESFYQLQLKTARDQGHGEISLNSETKNRLVEIALKDQRESLAEWLDYFLSPEADLYPMWIKYWSFQSIIKMGRYDPETGIFSARSKGQMGIFPELNPEAFGLVVDWIGKTLKKERLSEIQDETLLRTLSTKSFSRIYGQTLRILAKKKSNSSHELKGKWIKYPRESDHLKLVAGIKGHSTGWCTVGESTAEEQLKKGDFFVYYSNDPMGEPTLPRVAIRMEGERIAEVKGVASGQNLDSAIAESTIVDEKLSEFGEEGHAFRKRSLHMRTLTEIEKKSESKKALTAPEIRFLYELDEEIEGFGSRADPRIEEIRSSRDKQTDLANAFKIKPEYFSITEEQAFNGKSVFHFGDLYLFQDPSSGKPRFPDHVEGSVGIQYNASISELFLPESIRHNLTIAQLRISPELRLPKKLLGSLFIEEDFSAIGVKFPDEIEGSVVFRGLTSAKGLKLSDTIKASLSLPSLKSAKFLVLPKVILGDLTLSEIRTPQYLVLPEYVGGVINLAMLNSALGLILPKKLNGDLALSSLTSAKGLQLPLEMDEEIAIYLDGLLSLEDFILPRSTLRTLKLNKILFSDFKKRFGIPKNIKNIVFKDGYLIDGQFQRN
jgi:hypothetical protein